MSKIIPLISSLSEIKKLIPHREPMIMVDKLISADEESSKTELTIKAENLFVKNGVFQESGILEHIAQSCALQTGFLNHDTNEKPKVGFIAAINKSSIIKLPKIGDVVNTKIKTEYSSPSMLKINAECSIQGLIFTTASMTLVINL